MGPSRISELTPNPLLQTPTSTHLTPIPSFPLLVPTLTAKGGRVVNVGSATGTLAAQCDGTYAASKHALEGLTDSLRLELSAWDMSVSLVVPGQVSAVVSAT